MNIERKIIFVRVEGGLGNQLFQYAMWRRLVNHYPNAQVKLDCSRLSGRKRSFDLKKLGFNPPIQNVSVFQDRIAKYAKILNLNRFNQWLKAPILIQETDMDSFDAVCASIDQTKRCIIEGYWQKTHIHTDVIQEISESICRFQPHNAVSSNMQELAQHAIAIHVRLDDYQLPENQLIFKQMQTDYFINGVESLEAQNQNRRVIIFSDSPETVLKLHPALSQFDCLFAKDFCKNHVEEFLWMKDFKRVVISNSTFSYWSSSVGEEPGVKKRVFPKDFFCSPARNAVYKRGELFSFKGEIKFL